MTWLRVFLPVCVGVTAVALLGAWALRGFDTFGLSVQGLLALIAGAVLTCGLAIGLMALVFLSDRSGHDDAVGHSDSPDDPV